MGHGRTHVKDGGLASSKTRCPGEGSVSLDLLPHIPWSPGSTPKGYMQKLIPLSQPQIQELLAFSARLGAIILTKKIRLEELLLGDGPGV